MNDVVKEYLEPGKKNLILIYVLYLLGGFISLLPIIGGAFAYANIAHKDPILQSHYIFAFRTFWLSIVGFVIAFITTLIFIGVIIYMLVFVWVVMRSIIAIQCLLEGAPHPNPSSFWIK